MITKTRLMHSWISVTGVGGVKGTPLDFMQMTKIV